MNEINFWFACLQTKPFGSIWAAVSETGLFTLAAGVTESVFIDDLKKETKSAAIDFNKDRLAGLFDEIDAYLASQLRVFTTPIDWSGIKGFQKEVLEITYAIPYGETRTYQQIALGLGRPGAARAVGRAEATNPIPLVIPCHRVIGSDGRLHGYGMGSGIAAKRWLLDLEGTPRQMQMGF